MDKSKLTPGQVADLLQIHPRTLRRWCKAFQNALSESAGRIGRKRFFDGEDVETLRRAGAMLADGMSMKDVAEILPIRPSNDRVTALTLSTESALVLGTMIERTQVIGDKIGEIVDDQDELKKRIDSFERWFNQPWYKRIFGKPPSP